MKIKLIKYHPKSAESVGDVFDTSPERGSRLLEEGYAVLAEESDSEDRSDKDAGAALNDAKGKGKKSKFKNP